MAKVIGIDLGTTNTVVAVMDGAKPRIIENREGRNEMRSVVSLKNRKDRKGGGESREELVGHVAEDNAALDPQNTIISIKRLMGRALDDAEVSELRSRYRYRIVEPSDGTTDSIRVVLDGKELSPSDISAKILVRAKEDAERTCGGEVKYAVITVPAYFSEAQRDATKKAGTKAGLTVVKLLDEPTAAAIAFGVEANTQQQVRTLLVYDLGGGTFDISVLMMANGVFAPLALKGDMWLGGDDFDQKLIDVALYYVRDEFGVDGRKNDRFMVELRKAARTTKERLTVSQSADLIVPGLLRDKEQNLIDLSLEFAREEFEAMIRPLVRKSIDLTLQAVADAHLTPDKIDCVLLAGNASRVPLVQREIEKLFGRGKILRNVAPKHSVALGAAIVGAQIGERVICQAPDAESAQKECGHVNRPDATHCARAGCGAALPIPLDDGPVLPSSLAPFHYGAATVEDRFNLFVRKGDPYPTEDPKTQIFGTNRPNQRIITVPVYGGENLERASANEKQGEAVAILPPRLPKGTSIAISIWLDAEGLFSISARLADGTDLRALKTKGESDAKAIAILLEIEQTVASRNADLAPALGRVEQAMNRGFDKLHAGDGAGALGEAEALRAMIVQMLPEGERDDRSRRESLLAYCDSIVERYHWVDPKAMAAFAHAVQHTRWLLNRRGSEIQPGLGELEQAWSSLPESVLRFINCRRVILTRIRPVDLATAALLEHDLDGLEQAFKGNNPRAMDWWTGFTKRLNQAVDRAEKERPSAIRCYNGHEVPPGNRFCPAAGCGVDVTGLMHKNGDVSQAGSPFLN